MRKIEMIKDAANTVYDRVIIKHRRNTEIKKFKDKRRIAIYNQIQLTQDQKKAIDAFYVQYYGKKVPYVWHRHFTAYTGRFDVRYFPELLAIPEFERFMNPYEDYVRVFGDKNILPMLAQTAGVKMPETVISVAKGLYRDGNYNLITQDDAVKLINTEGKVFIKPSVDSSSGDGCAILDVHEGVDRKTGNALISILNSMGRDFVVQKLVKCHKSISDIYSGSVNTFRIITYRWNDKIEHCPVIMRIGRGGNCLDNAHAGGMFIAVNDDGTLHKTAFTEFRDAYDVHPDTQIVYDGYKIEHFDEVIKSAKKMHEAIPQIGMVNWDFTIDQDGVPTMIEANTMGGSVWLAQMAHGQGIFKENTAEILKYIAEMKKLTPRERSNKYWKIIENWK